MPGDSMPGGSVPGDEISGPVAVCGAGTMGRGIAYVAAVGGAPVRLADVDPDQLADALARIDRDLDEGVARDKITEDAAERARARISTGTDLAAACDGAAVVIEAVVESMQVKHEVLTTAAAAAADDAVLATNTSALSVTEIIGVLEEPGRGIGMHFFNPVPKMPLCELVIGLQTAPATIRRAAAAAAAMGKETVEVQDLPGFATSRLNALIGNEGFRMLEEGVASPEDIDRAARLGLNHPMGPLEMADLVGLDVRLEVLEHLTATLGERFRPTNVHRRLVAADRLGRKTGQGVYRYEDGRRTDEPSDLG